jgi:hypothetical protein
MKKLIHKDPETGKMIFSIREMREIFDTLHAYEETGLTPEQIEALKIDKLNLIAMVEQLEKIRAERDSMAAYLKRTSECGLCKYCYCAEDEGPCESCYTEQNYPKWEWKGA